MYFVSNVFIGAEVLYHKIEKLVVNFVVATMKFGPLFQGHKTLIKPTTLFDKS